MRTPDTPIVFQPITKMKNTTCVFHRYNSQLHFIDFDWPKNSPMHHAFPQGLKRAHQKYSWSSVISGEIKRSHVLLQMYPFHSNIRWKGSINVECHITFEGNGTQVIIYSHFWALRALQRSLQRPEDGLRRTLPPIVTPWTRPIPWTQSQTPRSTNLRVRSDY